MATDKKLLRTYIGSEVSRDIGILYIAWGNKRRNRGLVPSMSKFIESILKDFTERNRGILEEYDKVKQEYDKLMEEHSRVTK